MLGSPIACTFDQSAACVKRTKGNAYREFEGQKNTLAGWLADTSAKRRQQGFADGDLSLTTIQPVSQQRETTTGHSKRMTPTKPVFAFIRVIRAIRGQMEFTWMA